MDISKYGIRVIRLNKEYYKAPLITSKKRPIDVEGTVLKILFPSIAIDSAIRKGKWFEVFFSDRSTNLRIRWDNDEKGTCPLDALTICSIGSLPMCWPLYAPSRADLAHKFDFRRPEDRCPITTDKLKHKHAYSKYTLNNFHDLIKQHAYEFNVKDTENTVISTMPRYEANKRSAHAYQYYGVDRSQRYTKQTEPIPQPEAPPETPEVSSPARLAREAQYRENRKNLHTSSYDTFFNIANGING